MEKQPVQTGQKVELTITGYSHSGEGVGKYEGFTLFVPFAVLGERVLAQVEAVKKNHGRARMVEVIRPSPERSAPPCGVFGKCGGCQLQHVSYAEQLRMKERQVRDSFFRIGRMEEVMIHPVIGMDHPWGYRNKAQVPFGMEGGKVVAGFYAPKSHRIVDTDACLIQHPLNDRVIRKVKQLARRLNTPIYDERNHCGILRHVMVRTGFHTGECMVVLVTNGENLPRRQQWVEELRREIPGLKSVVQNVNPRRTNVILGPENRLLWGRKVIYDRIGDVVFAISPNSFFQVNPVQTKVLYDQVAKYAALTGVETVIDAYCGIGTIALYLARRAKRVYGVDVVGAAIRDAKQNAALNGMGHVTFEEGAAEEVMPRWHREGIRPDVIVLDPPRKGCDPALLETAASMKPGRIVYVSCNPATLARDAKYLSELGYRVREVQPVDMFPQTGHVECCALLEPK
ncbi:23S rRNA (uracil1939-C5)-methyltransferase [Planifilum fulgidum]|jgi:23S rRNA (uracil1939-C5)-methyltransferase|uniref:23S rRNA (Uracil1939-C5)-methyltransferase n=1 Tax=Planifilum fulgidum TaxID=201973 RepID=A0A1I2QPT1_9BACL|nr:23S rRNA (uracil(1939)-C(5))-methyltransferase RlmD [Planifilum fulgidum]MBO2496050.1 23S rRNA (uracil(1939)-C(5))-methyltransferase RlmD [Bacillota bacterium]SFG30442.1 23S rRNA (uracil1939-C5)-methyltransferase [Planifilum fulgidum]